MNDTRIPPRERSWLEVQWRKWRNPPPPVLRAVLADLFVAVVGGLGLWLYAILAPAADITPWVIVFVLAVIVVGSFFTYLWVELPTGSGTERRRSAWAGVLGLFAAVPIAYLALVVVFQILLGR